MSIERWELAQRQKGNTAGAEMARILREQYGDEPLPTHSPETPTAEDDSTATILQQAVTEYIANPHNPEVVTASFHAIWHVRAEKLKRVGVEITLPGDGYSEEELKRLEANGRRPGYLPPELATQEARHLLAVIWPEMGSFSVKEGNPVTNEENLSGWFDYEASVDAPFTNTTEDQLRKAIKKEGKNGINLNEYIVAGEDSKLLTGRYLNEGKTGVRLLGSRYGGGVVEAYFDSYGLLTVGSILSPQYHDRGLAGRSVGVPKALA